MAQEKPMIIPRYWAECRLQERVARRQVTVRRFGWSSDSQEAAQEHANQRAAEALRQAIADDCVVRREPRVPYHGSEGMPIREEIVAEHGDTIITRNSYGAHCLNTPNVLIVDVDDDSMEGVSAVSTCVLPVLGIVTAIPVGWYLGSLLSGALVFFVLTVVAPFIFHTLVWLRVSLAGGPRKFALRKFARWVTHHPEWRLRVYETPAGLRAMALHATFDATDPAVTEFFRNVGSDPVYVAMCRNQKCFRARLTAKPWRIGINAHMKPRPGVWPVAPERLPVRQAWIDEYERVARDHAACRFIAEYGTGSVHRDADAVRRLHDDLSGATSGRPIA
jgi:hypothetical protein